MIVNWKKTKRDLKRKYHLGNYKKDIVDPHFSCVPSLDWRDSLLFVKN